MLCISSINLRPHWCKLNEQTASNHQKAPNSGSNICRSSVKLNPPKTRSDVLEFEIYLSYLKLQRCWLRSFTPIT
ncbi:Uncharacterised protein [Vibrio cholerae]|nr:Uncharacterised protein [Vibrio cholerae]